MGVVGGFISRFDLTWPDHGQGEGAGLRLRSRKRGTVGCDDSGGRRNIKERRGNMGRGSATVLRFTQLHGSSRHSLLLSPLLPPCTACIPWALFHPLIRPLMLMSTAMLPPTGFFCKHKHTSKLLGLKRESLWRVPSAKHRVHSTTVSLKDSFL